MKTVYELECALKRDGIVSIELSQSTRADGFFCDIEYGPLTADRVSCKSATLSGAIENAMIELREREQKAKQAPKPQAHTVTVSVSGNLGLMPAQQQQPPAARPLVPGCPQCGRNPISGSPAPGYSPGMAAAPMTLCCSAHGWYAATITIGMVFKSTNPGSPDEYWDGNTWQTVTP